MRNDQWCVLHQTTITYKNTSFNLIGYGSIGSEIGKLTKESVSGESKGICWIGFEIRIFFRKKKKIVLYSKYRKRFVKQ